MTFSHSFRFQSNGQIVLRPEGSGTLHDPVRLEGRSAFDPGDFPRKGVTGFQPHMDMVWHQHPRSQIIPSFRGPFSQHFYHDSGHFRFSQPPWSGRGRIQQSAPATTAAPWVVQRSATAATGNQPANRHVTKYPTPSGCQCGRRRCIPQVFQKCLSPPETRLKSRAQETSNRPAISWTLH